MPPANKAAAAAKLEYAMPRPPAIVLWFNAPGVPPSHAVVTAYGKHAVNLMVFPPDSRIGIPKDGVRFVDDPWNVKNGINPDSGAWDYTSESKALQNLEGIVAGLVGDSLAGKPSK